MVPFWFRSGGKPILMVAFWFDGDSMMLSIYDFVGAWLISFENKKSNQSILTIVGQMETGFMGKKDHATSDC